MEITVRPAAPADAEQLIPLLTELSARAGSLGVADVAARLQDDRVHVVVGAADGLLVGTATLTLLVTLTEGLIGRVEDVVVSESARGSGLGRRLVLALHDEARELGITKVELTSRPSRDAANRLYRSLGYDRRETNVYRLHLA
jgi:ribosomal protein S18 acetylase RimI-like enzyme